MRESVATALLELNREFYRVVAAPFNMTRMAWSPGKERLLTYAPPVDEDCPLRVADIGCGNGRLGWMLDTLARPVDYVGVDADSLLLAAAAENTAELANVQSHFVRADLAEAGWHDEVSVSLSGDELSGIPGLDQKMSSTAKDGGLIPECDQLSGFDLVTCLATVQHMPDFDLRARILRELAALLASDGLMIVSAWQFMESERLRSKLLDWAEIGVDPAEVEPGDALLPWKQDVYAIRYVHQIDQEEMNALADAAHLTIVDSYRADGREGNLNLYCVMRNA